MEDPILAEARRRLAAAQAEAERLASFIATYEEIAPVVERDTHHVDAVPRLAVVPLANGRSLTLTERVAVEVIKQFGRPVTSPEMLAEVVERGVEVGGKDRASTLAARLSRAPSIEFERGVGWKLRQEAPRKDEAADPAVEAKEPAASEETTNDAIARGEVAHHNMIA